MASLPARLSEHIRITIYADDICIWTSGVRRDAIQQRLQGALNTTASYLADRGLRVSPSKTAAMAFTRRPFTSYPLHVAGTPLQFVTHCKYLGVIIDRQLSWSKHIKNLSVKTSRSVNVLRRISGASWGPTCRDLRQIHSSLVLGLLRYSIPVLHGLRTTHERELLNIQSRSLRACLGLPKTTETYSVLAEAREPLVTTLRDRETLRIYTRLMTRHPFHYLRTIDHDSPASAFGSAVRRLKGVVPPPTSHVSYATPTWALDQPPICTFIHGLGKKSDTPAPVAHQLALEHLSSLHHGRQTVYTDGSVIPGGAAAAFYVPHEDFERASKLPNETSSTEAELFAINMALQHISSSPPAEWTILTDSKPALEILGSHATKIISDLQTAIIAACDSLCASGHGVRLQWVPSHIGLSGNSRADAAARRAHQDVGPPASMPLTSSACLIKIREWCASEMRRSVEDAVRSNAYIQSIDPTMQFAPYQQLVRAEETLLHRLRLNVAYTPQYLCRVGKRRSASCATCGAVADVEHLLLICSEYSAARAVLANRLQRLGHGSLSLAVLLGPVARQQQGAVTRALLQYLQDTQLSVTL
ncbi:uncharacterized protein LOC135398559 [Ornithodoros turicata]|uniref:uncharacterized protein LOC135398559 n=1 Tax=Ornithodoros turicata TaxID=34597 RepID=UPI00313A3E79